MNERIRELAEQVGHTPLEPRTFADDLTEIFLQKFAELIVKDCLNELCDQMYKHNIDLSNLPAWYKSIEAVEKKFGVEQ